MNIRNIRYGGCNRSDGNNNSSDGGVCCRNGAMQSFAWACRPWKI
jgi:hypothetical protein